MSNEQNLFTFTLRNWYVGEHFKCVINQIAFLNVQNILKFNVKSKVDQKITKQNYINSSEISKTPTVIIFCGIKVEFLRKLIFPNCSWLHEFEGCPHIEGTFFLIASFSTNRNTQCFGLIDWWRSYKNIGLTCLTVFVQPNPYIPFGTISSDSSAIKLSLWNNERRKVFDANHQLKSSFICGNLCSNLIRLALKSSNE